MAKLLNSDDIYQPTENSNTDQKPYKWSSIEVLKYNKYSKYSGKLKINFKK